MPIMIKRRDGTLSKMKNSEYLTAFYAIPREIIEFACPDLLKVSRSPFIATRDWEQIAMIESDLFLLAIIDLYAFMVWEHFGISPYMEIYSGYDPLWKLAHQPSFWIKTMIDEKIILSVEELLKMVGQDPNYIMPYPSIVEMNTVMKYTVQKTVQDHNLVEIIKTIEENRCWEDFDFRDSKQKTDFYRKWYHTRTKHPQISLEAWKEDYVERHNGMEFDVPGDDNVSLEVTDRVQVKQFTDRLSEKDKQILKMRMQGLTLEEIAEKLGYKNHSGVLKRIRKIGQKYEAFANVNYGFTRGKII